MRIANALHRGLALFFQQCFMKQLTLTLFNLLPMQSMLLFAVGTIGSCMLCYATPYTPETLPAKIGAFTLFTSIMGVTLAPLITIAGDTISLVHVHVHVHV